MTESAGGLATVPYHTLRGAEGLCPPRPLAIAVQQ